MFRNHGYCHACGCDVEFIADSDWWRDSYRCSRCDSLPRERALMFCIEKNFPYWRNLTIHESSPEPRGTSERLRREVSHYIPTQFYPHVPPGALHGTHRCENLEALTFGDSTIDLHVTQDVFEHVLNPADAFREIARTLRPEGAHIFTTPLVRRHETTQYCAKSAPDGTILQLTEPAEYHGNPISSKGSLVTVKWGYDIADYIFKACGLFTRIILIDNIDLGIRAEYIEVLLTYKPRPA